MKKLISTTFMIAILTAVAYSQNYPKKPMSNAGDSVKFYRCSVSTTYLTFANTESEETNVHMIEFHFGYRITSKDKIGIKVAKWELFEPMGIQFWDPLLLKESEWYPGKLKEMGIGITYQRILWKGLFATVEVLPLKKTYLDKNNVKIGSGFKLYTTYHIGYHVALFKDRLYLEPQIHCNYWPIDSKGPQGFADKDSKWKNYFLFEPNLYFGINF